MIGSVTALWLGILISISPCPLATKNTAWEEGLLHEF